MYKRGNWSIMGLDTSSLGSFKDFLENNRALLDMSAVLSFVNCKCHEISSVGINPFAQPRLDESIFYEQDGKKLVYSTIDDLAKYGVASPEERLITDTDKFLPHYGSTKADYTLEASREWYGFWFVGHVWKDTNDQASLKESMSYLNHQRPYAFLTGDDKKMIDASASAQTSILRRQFPVLIDFNEGLIFAETTAKPELEVLISSLGSMGIVVEPRIWFFGENWVEKFLTYIAQNTKHHADFAKRAEELTRFKKSEVEKLDDKLLERIVSNYFAITELPNGMWACLKPVASFRLHPASEAPLSASTPSNAFTLCNLTNECSVAAAAVIFQELNVKVSGDQEKVYRTDLFSATVDPLINEGELGVAFLKGFDLPPLKREINREIKKTKQVPEISHYWNKWMQGIRESIATFSECLKLTLELDGKEDMGLIKPESLGVTDEEVAVE